MDGDLALVIDRRSHGMWSTSSVLRRALAAAASLCALGLLASCGEAARSVGQTVGGAIGRSPALPISPAEVAARPLFQMVGQTQHGQALLILGNVDGIQEVWYGPRGTALFLERGRIVKTANLEQNLDASRISGVNPFESGLHRIHGTVDYESTDDWSPGYRYGVPVSGHLVPSGVETIEILGKPRQALRVDDIRTSKAANWSATSHFWVDPATGFVLKSEQWLAPGLRVDTLQLKPRLQGGPI